MSLRAKPMLLAMLLASPLGAASPAWASGGPSGASTGGASTGPAPLVSGSGGAFPTTASGTQVQTGSLVTTTGGDGITVTTNVSALLGRALAFSGTATATRPGVVIVVQRLDPVSGWVSVANGTVGSGGDFSVVWRPDSVGRLSIRTVLAQATDASQAAATAPTLQITVYRPGIATFYGQGFFGQKTACGKTLRRSTLGVANRTLKCGTPVQIYYHGRTIVVPVIDRGPYANHASWDLTQATAQALGMMGTETVGAMLV